MKITDLHDCEIEVTDLKEAIKIAKKTQDIATRIKVSPNSTNGKKPIGWIYMGNY